ncbi:MAG: T9SS type A sorting domain-containing protein [Fidelibacterota bacterium]
MTVEGGLDIIGQVDAPSIWGYTWIVEGTISSVERGVTALPGSAYLSQNYPNPFNVETKIEYYIPKEGNVSIKIFNINGENIRTLISGFQTEGNHHVIWDGLNDKYIQISSGVYFLTLEYNDYVRTRKMVYLK